MPKNETIVRLKIISSSHTPEMITEIIGLGFDKCWRVGDKRRHTIIEEKNNGWVLNSGLPRTASLEKQVQTLLGRVGPLTDAIKLLSRDDTVEVSCVLYTDSVPALNFSANLIEQLGRLGASLDVDLFLGEGAGPA